LTGYLEYLFVKKNQTPWSDTQWISQYYWYPLLKKLGLKERRMYEMRHTFATNMLNSNYFKVTDIAKMMGHSTTEHLFNVYSRYIEAEQDKIPLDKSIY
jgi:integrase